MLFEKAKENDFELIKRLYWELIDDIRSENDKIGRKKGIYPTDDFLRASIANEELYKLTDNDDICACVVLNSLSNEGYTDVKWHLDCGDDNVMIPHAPAVTPRKQGRGTGTMLVNEMIRAARAENKKALRLDIIGTNTSAERLYTKCGFRFIEAKQLFYEDTGLTEYKMFELAL